MLNILKRVFLGAPPKRIRHPVFGMASLIDTPSGPYWEIECEIHGKPFAVSIDTEGEQEPTLAQVEFFHRYADHPDRAFALVRELLIDEYERWIRAPFPAEWTAAFELVGMAIPRDGDADGKCELSFECLTDPSGHLFSCSIENGKPVSVSVDG